MKNSLVIILGTVFIFSVSCKKKPKTADDTKEDRIELNAGSDDMNVESKAVAKVKDCDDFIDQYEKWSEEYIAFLTKYKDDPMEAFTSPEYSQMVQRAASWSQEWLSISVSCAQNPSYEKKVKEIADRMDEEMKELGFKE